MFHVSSQNHKSKRAQQKVVLIIKITKKKTQRVTIKMLIDEISILKEEVKKVDSLEIRIIKQPRSQVFGLVCVCACSDLAEIFWGCLTLYPF
jgi:hypothetical protein